MNELFKDDLLKNEEILWCSQPETVLFSVGDFFLIPFSFLWGGFAIFWEASVFTNGAPFFFRLFGIPFVIVGLYFIFGRFIYKRIKKKHTYYSVTNKRILILTNLFTKGIEAEFINQITCINKSVRSNGIGTLKFGNSPFFQGMWGNSGMEFFNSHYRKDVPSFYDIQDAEEVYRIASELKNS